MCKSQFTDSGLEVSLTAEERERILETEINTKCAKKGLRTLVYAYKDYQQFDWDFMRSHNNNFLTEKDRENIEKDFCFVAAFGLNDDLRDGVKDSVKKLAEG